MAQVVASYQVSAFVTPVNATTNDADQVRGNDNTLRTALDSHDADSGIHFQSSTLGSRPAAGTAGQKWLTTDDFRVFYDDGSNWREIAYAPTVSPTFTGTVTIPASVATSSNTTLNIGGFGGLQFGGGSIQLDQGGFKTSAAALLLNATAVAGQIQFQTNGAVRWVVNASGHLICNADGVYDIGAAGATRARTIYLTGSTTAINANGTKVLGLQQSGYTNAWTGALNRATAYDVATVTLAQLAGRVAALQADVTTHGLIGV